jgi:biotin carboxyl carrier protein
MTLASLSSFVIATIATLSLAAIAQSPRPVAPPVAPSIAPAPSIAIAPTTPPPYSPTPHSPKPDRLTLTLHLTHPEDLKIKPGDRLMPGQVIADRSTDRDRLQAKQDQLDLNIQQLSQPIASITPPPPINLSAETAAIASARSELELLKSAPLPEYRFIDPRMDPAITQQRFDVKAAQVRAAANVNQAIANLDRARQGQQQRLYDHGLNVQRQQVEQRRQQFDVAQLVAARETVAGQLAEMAAVRSPYGGTVRRVRVLGQADRLMAVEVVVETVAVKDGDGAEWMGAKVKQDEARSVVGQQPVKAGAEWSVAAP